MRVTVSPLKAVDHGGLRRSKAFGSAPEQEREEFRQVKVNSTWVDTRGAYSWEGKGADTPHGHSWAESVLPQPGGGQGVSQGRGLRPLVWAPKSSGDMTCSWANTVHL